VPKRIPTWVFAVWSWLRRQRFEVLYSSVLGAITVVFLILIFTNKLNLFPGDLQCSRLYLLSAIVQALAAILAIVITLTLVVTQLAAQMYTPRVIRLRMTDLWFWSAVVLYAFTIIWSLLAKSQYLNFAADARWNLWSVDLAVLGAIVSLLYLAPFFTATTRSLQPAFFARTLLPSKKPDPYEVIVSSASADLRRRKYAPLDDLMRKAVNEGLISLLSDALDALDEHAKQVLQLGERPDIRALVAQSIVKSYVGVGKHACRRGNTEAWTEISKRLTDTVSHCTKKEYRAAADVFNEAFIELYEYGVEILGGKQ